MYRTTAATGGSHPQHILLLGTHIFPAKCQLGEEIKVSQGLGSCTRGIRISYEFTLLLQQHQPPPGDEPSGAASSQTRFQQHHLLPPSPAIPECLDAHGDPKGVPRDAPLTMMSCTGAAARWSLHQLLSRAGGASMQPGRQGQGSVRDQPLTPRIQLRHPGQHSNSLLSPLEIFQSLQGCSHHTRTPQDTQHSRWPLPKPDVPCTSHYRSTSSFVKNDTLRYDASETFITQ